ncbi:MAG: uracil-DNA glycosylase [Candidatus Protistobacter heckmanni]|nr:uracil-DNA glycosylase [Candidatus Protistobacter heckmanni]
MRDEAMLHAMGIRTLWVPRETKTEQAVADADAVAALRQEPAEHGAVDAGGAAPRQAANQPMDHAPPSGIAAEAATGRAVSTPSTAGGVADLDWPALESAVKDCRLCKLCDGRTQTVFGVGNRQATWMAVGEAPGEQEDLKGEPFVGQAGKLLDNMLRTLDLSREKNVFIANVLKCRPPGNRDPQPDEVAACEPYLLRQIALVKPQMILVMGRFAAHTLLRTDTPVGKLRGKVHEYAGVPLVVSYHPAYLLRTPADKAKAWQDLCLAKSVADGQPPSL